MRDAILLQQVWPGGVYEKMMELTRKRHGFYCEKHDMDYKCLVGVTSEKYGDLSKGSWCKVEMLQKALADGYEYAVFLEPDTLIKDMDANLRDGCPNGIGACFHRVFETVKIPAQWCVGAVYAQNSYEVKNFVNEWLAGFPGDPQWRDNGVFNKIGMKSRVVHTISDKWNATLNVNMCPDAVVLGFHGNGNAQQRYELMQQTMGRLHA